jgi:hypothetical protein
MAKEKITDKLNNIESNLNMNALFKLSLGSKELFHSNLLESILGIDDENGRYFSCEFFKLLGIPGLENITKIETEREKNHIDISFRFYKSEKVKPVKTIFIENKVKSLPDLDQLNKYRKDLKGKNREFILLSLIMTEFKEKKSKWRHFSYGNVADKLEIAIRTTKGNLPTFSNIISFDKLIDEYCAFIKELSLIGSIIETKPEDLYIFSNGQCNGVDFRKLRIHDLVLKLKYQQIERLFKDRNHSVKPDKLLKSNGHKIDSKFIYSNTGFTNSQGLFDIKIYMGEINGLLSHFLVVQLQGDQLRYGSYLMKKESSVSDAQIKDIHTEVVKGLLDKWFNNNILVPNKEQEEVLKLRKGAGRAKKDKETGDRVKPGYDKFGDEFYFRYDIIVKYTGVKKDKKMLTDNTQTSIIEIIEYFSKLAKHIFENRVNIKKEINAKSKYKIS